MPIDGFEAEHHELLRQLAEQGEKLKAAEARADEADGLRRMDNAAMLDLNKLKQAAEAERDGLKARLERMTEVQDNMLGALAAYEDQVQALEQRIAGAKVCSHIYTRVALTSTTTCPACTNGIVWPEPAGDSPVSDEVAELRRKIAGARVCHSHKSIKPDDCDVCDEHGIVWPPEPAEQVAAPVADEGEYFAQMDIERDRSRRDKESTDAH